MAATTMASLGAIQLKPSLTLPLSAKASVRKPVAVPACATVCAAASSTSSSSDAAAFSRREAAVTILAASVVAFNAAAAPPARAELLEDYKRETEAVIEQLRTTLAMDKSDPDKVKNVDSLRAMSNDWVAKYRREKQVGGKPSFGNLYSALNAVSGHYIAFGSSYPIPKKRQERILEEVTDAERALKRGR